MPKTASSQAFKGGLQPLDDAELAAVGGQGFNENFRQMYALVDRYDQEDSRAGKLVEGRDRENSEIKLFDGIKVLGTMGRVFFPIANVLDADIEMEGVYYDPSRLKPLITEDGTGFNVNLPSRIERLSFIDIRAAGSQGSSMGSIHLEGIRFTDNVNIVVRPH